MTLKLRKDVKINVTTTSLMRSDGTKLGKMQFRTYMRELFYVKGVIGFYWAHFNNKNSSVCGTLTVF